MYVHMYVLEHATVRERTAVSLGQEKKWLQFWLKVERPSTFFGAASVTIRYELSFGFLPAQVITTYIYCLLSRTWLEASLVG